MKITVLGEHKFKVKIPILGEDKSKIRVSGEVKS